MGAWPTTIGRFMPLHAQDINMNSSHIFCLFIASLACATDLNTRRIPNVLTFGAALMGFLYQFLNGGLDGLGQAALGWLVGALIFSVPFALHGLGGGDVKLLAALGAWLGPADAVWLALYTAVAGGLMALAVSAIYGYLGTAFRNVYLLLCHWRVAGIETVPSLTLEHSKGPKLAYAFPILTGMMATTWLR